MSAPTASTNSPLGTTAVVIPVYNEGPMIGEVVADVRRYFERVVCVDDGSTDDSAHEVVRAGADLVRHPINLGQGAALQTGVEYALLDPQVRYVVTFDADGQHRVEDALAMVQILDDGQTDIVFGSRFLDDRTEVSRLKRLVLQIAARYTNVTSGVKLTDAHNGLRAFTRDVAEKLELRQNGMAHASELVDQVGRLNLRVREQPVHILYTDYSRAKGQSLFNSVNILFDLFFR